MNYLQWFTLKVCYLPNSTHGNLDKCYPREIFTPESIHKCCCHPVPCRNHKIGALSFSPLRSSPHEHLHDGSSKQNFSQSITNLEENPGLPVGQGTVTLKPPPCQMWWAPKNIPWAFQGKDILSSKAERRWVGRNRRKTVTAMDISCDFLEIGWTCSEPARGALLIFISTYLCTLFWTR